MTVMMMMLLYEQSIEEELGSDVQISVVICNNTVCTYAREIL